MTLLIPLPQFYKENKSDFLSTMNKDDDTLTFILLLDCLPEKQKVAFGTLNLKQEKIHKIQK